jgi:hypothetical protein
MASANYCRTKVRFWSGRSRQRKHRMQIKRGRGYKNLRYLLLKVTRMTVTNVQFIAVRSVEKAA